MSLARLSLDGYFRAVVHHRRAILAVYALLFPIAVLLSLGVPHDNSIERLVVASDPDYANTLAFRKIFPEPQRAFLLVEVDDPFAPAVLARIDELERRLGALGGVTAYSGWRLFRESTNVPADAAAGSAAFREFAAGTDLLRRQGLVGSGHLGIPLEIDAKTPAERNRILAAIDTVLAPYLEAQAPFTAIRRVGGPWIDAHLERATAQASARYFPLFGAFVIVLNWILYRSWRTLAAFLFTLAEAVALSVAVARLAGFSFSIVSSLVPLTVLVTCTAALVYLQSRFIDKPADVPVEEHRIFALRNKFLPTTASLFAAAVGFAALAVSKIRPIREMGLWVALGLLMTWILIFSLFPALQKTLATPTRQRTTRAGLRLDRLLEALPLFSYRFRWPLVTLTLALCVAGAVALVGVPGAVAPMTLQTDALDYVDPASELYRDTRRFESQVSGLTLVEAWISESRSTVLDPEVLRGIADFTRRLELEPRIDAATGPTTVLRYKRYLGGGSDQLPEAASAWPKLAADLEQLLLADPRIRGFVDLDSLAEARVSIVARGAGHEEREVLRGRIESCWQEATRAVPALHGARLRVVGRGLIEAKIAHFLVPTLTESFVLTAGVLFVAFLVVFRSGAARMLALIPSMVAILVMFLIMRWVSIPLNVATILIASTVLGASENDQIHFFHHFQEARAGGSTETALRHALVVAGRAIVFATLINAGGFLALSLSDLPPMRQFGIVASSAFVLSMIASFTALPAAVWILLGDRPSLAPRNGRT